MVEAAVFQLLETFIQDEFTLLSGVREEIVHIHYEFEQMNAFLEGAEAYWQHHPELQVYVRQVQEVSYEAGDVLEQFMLRLNHRYGNGMYNFLKKTYFSARTLRHRHELATNVERIKYNVSKISQGYERYRGLLGSIEQESSSQTNDALLLPDEEIVGIEGPRLEIIKWFGNKDNRLQMLSVVGMGGIGKTTLVKKVFDEIHREDIFESSAWITVSKTYTVDRLLKDIIRQLFEGENNEVPDDDTKLKSRINNFLRHKRYLIVLDDVWNTHTWQALKYAFPDSNRGSRILLTTRISNIASSACKDYHGKVYNLLLLSKEKAWSLFCLKAFQGQACPSYLEGTSKDILKKCEGLPHAIATIGSYLSNQAHSRIDEWNLVYRSIGILLEREGNLHSLQVSLLRSYIDLPYHLKICFLYLSIFPKNYLMDHSRLVRLLVAEGLVKTKSTKKKLETTLWN